MGFGSFKRRTTTTDANAVLLSSTIGSPNTQDTQDTTHSLKVLLISYSLEPHGGVGSLANALDGRGHLSRLGNSERYHMSSWHTHQRRPGAAAATGNLSLVVSFPYSQWHVTPNGHSVLYTTKRRRRLSSDNRTKTKQKGKPTKCTQKRFFFYLKEEEEKEVLFFSPLSPFFFSLFSIR